MQLTYKLTTQVSALRSAPTLTRQPLNSNAVRFVLNQRFLTQEARTRIEGAVKANPVVLFMKGTPQEPQCGFSRAVVQILDIHGVPPEKMKTYNVLEDSELRSGIKEFS